MDTGGTSLQPAKHHESAVRGRINDAAPRLFAERGAARVNVKDLASYAGVARGTVYAHLLINTYCKGISETLHSI